MLELKNLSKAYKQNHVLSGVDLTVEDGEMIALLGPSGSGKTTILRLISGFLEADAGEILVDGQSVDTVPSHRRGIGVVFQDYALFPHMTVEQNVAFGLKMQKVPAPQMRERITEALELVGLEEYRSRYPSQLSGGQQQRVAIARVVAIRAKVMLLDEPLSNLDAKMRRQVRVELKELQRKLGITTLIVTHDQEEAMTMGNRIAILNEGRIQQVGYPMELYQKPANTFVAGFLGTPAINFFDLETGEGSHNLSGTPVPDDLVNASWGRLSPEEKYVLGVRPEHLVYGSEGGAGQIVLDSRVLLVEHLGSETLVYFSLADKICCCRTPMDETIAQGQDACFGIDLSKATLFDRENGCSIAKIR